MLQAMAGARHGATIIMHGTLPGTGTVGIGTGVRRGHGLGAGVLPGLGAGDRRGDPAGVRVGVLHGDPAGVVLHGDRHGLIIPALLQVVVRSASAMDTPA